jgi:hypothetical protein
MTYLASVPDLTLPPAPPPALSSSGSHFRANLSNSLDHRHHSSESASTKAERLHWRGEAALNHLSRPSPHPLQIAYSDAAGHCVKDGPVGCDDLDEIIALASGQVRSHSSPVIINRNKCWSALALQE